MAKRGRPKQHPIDKLRTRIWFAEASETLGGKTAYWFWKEINKEKGSLSKWNKYRTGERVPSYLNGKGAVDMVAKEWPGTETIFRALIWSILKGTSLSEDEIIKELSGLGGQFSALPKIMLEGGFWKQRNSDGFTPLMDIFDQIANDCDSDFYTLQAVVLLMAWADELKNNDFWNSCCDLYRQMLPAFILGVDAPYKNEIFDHIDQYALRREFPAVNRREDIFLSWRDQIPRFQVLLSEHYSACFKVQRKYGVLPEGIFSDSVCDEFAIELTKAVVGDDNLMVKCRELWKPISWELAKFTRGYFEGQIMASKKFSALLNKEIGYFLDETTRPKNYTDTFSIEFRG